MTTNVNFPFEPNFSGPLLSFKDQGDGTYALPVAVVSGGGGGGGGTGYSISDLIVQDSTNTQGIRREKIDSSGNITFAYENFDGSAWTPTPPMVAVAIAPSAGIATSAKQDTGNTSLASIDTKTPTVGQKTMAGSRPVVLPSDQVVPTTSANDVTVAATNVTAQNTNPNGTAVANSAIVVALNGHNTVTANISVHALGAAITAQVTADGVNWVNYAQYATLSTNNPLFTYSSTIVNGTTGQFQWTGLGGVKGFRLSANTATVSGTLTASLNASTAATSNITNVALNQISGAGAAVLNQSGGSSSGSLGVFLAAATSAADYTGLSVSAASGNGTTIADMAGQTVSYDFNVTALTLGSSAGLTIYVQSAKDAGTTWEDVWQTEEITAVGHYSTPPLLIAGARRRIRWVNRTAAATTATLTATANRMSIAPAHTVRQWMDRTSGVLAGTTGTFTPWFDVAGCKSISAFVPLGVASGPATYQLQLSPDGVIVLPGGAPALAGQSTTTAYTNSSGTTARFARLAVTTASTSQTPATTPVVITGC